MNDILRKELKALRGQLEDNRIRVVASTVGNADRGGDVILPGAFKSAVLRGAVDDGWLDLTHEWGLPIGFITDAKMFGDELHMEAEFHSTREAQDVRTVVQERLAAGKSMSVSIGFMPDHATMREFASGDELLKWAEAEGYDLTAFDAKAIRRERFCRAIVSVSELFEVSVCPVGMNQKAKVREAKRLTAEEQFDEALDAFVLAIERDADIASLRQRIGAAQTERLGKALDVLIPLFQSRPAPEPEPAPDPTPDVDREVRVKRLLDKASLIA